MKTSIRKLLFLFLTLRFSLVSAFIIALSLFLVIFYLCRQSFVNSAELVAIDSTKLIQDMRTFYSKEVVTKLSDIKDIHVAADHFGKPNTIPLPATFILDTSDIISKKDLALKFRLYSAYPFKNRENRVLDGFEKKSIEYLQKNPTSYFSQTDELNGEPILRVAVPELMVSQSCVNCHNSHPDSTKRDWKVGDFRGVIEADYSLKDSFQQANLLALKAFLFVFITLGILMTFIYFLQKWVRREMTSGIKLKTEVEASAKIQQSIVPKDVEFLIHKFEFASYFKPAELCAGDWWQYYDLGDNKVLVFVGDVTGHGIASALVTAVVKGYCDSLKNAKHIDFNQVLTELNKIVTDCTHYESVLMSMFAILLDGNTNTVTYANAGHPFPIINSVKSDAKNDVRALIISGKLLGHTSDRQDVHYLEKNQQIYEDDVIVLFTDGLIERSTNLKPVYNTKKIYNIIKENIDKSANEIKELIVADTAEYYDGIVQDDDITLVVIKVK
jgi:serine phosphatase RsbU (regulator of sigma subunit)